MQQSIFNYTPPPKTNLYTAWGNQADTASKQGWYPEVQYGDKTVYRSNYSPAFSDVIIPNSKERGHIALIGSNNQKFDVVIRDSKGNIASTIFKGISPNEVQKYITSQNSVVAQRNNSVLKYTKPIDVATK